MNFQRFLYLTFFSIFLSRSLYANQCTHLENQARNAFYSGNLKSAKQAYLSIQNTSCLGSEKTYVARQIAYLMYDKLRKRNPTGGYLISGLSNIFALVLTWHITPIFLVLIKQTQPQETSASIRVPPIVFSEKSHTIRLTHINIFCFRKLYISRNGYGVYY